MKIKLLYSTPLVLIVNAIRMSRDNHYLSDSVDNNIGEKDFNLIKRVELQTKGC